MTRATRCRSCGSPGLQLVLSLGETPLADAFLEPADLTRPEPRFPLEVAFCGTCSLVQVLEEVPPEVLFVENYLYYSSFSPALLDHSREHALRLIEQRHLTTSSLVVEIASNDGYLLRNFAEHGVPVLGIDPAPGPAAAAEEAGIPTLREFFGLELARRLRDSGRRADVIIANNVMAHVPDLNGFVAGLRHLVTDDGLITVENPYVRDLVDRCAFDTIYHEHHCYFSCTAVDTLVRRHGLYLNDVEYFPDLHGGTLRWHISPREAVSPTATDYLTRERATGLTEFGYYADFARRADHVRAALPALLRDLRAGGARIAAYGAAAKGSTLLNSSGIGTDLLDFVVDRNTYKQGRLMPGVHVPIRGPEALLEDRPSHVLLLAWNFAAEVMEQQAAYREQGGRFILPVPEPVVV